MKLNGENGNRTPSLGCDSGLGSERDSGDCHKSASFINGSRREAAAGLSRDRPDESRFLYDCCWISGCCDGGTATGARDGKLDQFRLGGGNILTGDLEEH